MFYCKYDKQYDKMLIEINNMNEFFIQYKDNIIINITHSECIINNFKIQLEIKFSNKGKFTLKKAKFSYLNIEYAILLDGEN